MEKILLYIEKKRKKNILIYEDEKHLRGMVAPEKLINNGTVSNVAEIKEKWQIDKVDKTNNKLTIYFTLDLRKK
jgi:hypothetical protein